MDVTSIVFVGYTCGIFVIALHAFTATHDAAGFLLANRQLPSWRAALSAGASDMSGWLLLGLPGLAFIAHQRAIWLALGLAIGTYLNWKFIAAPLREKSITHNDALTLPTYFAARYPEQAKTLRIITAVTILIFYIIYLSAGMVAAAKLFVAVFGMEYVQALAISAIVVVTYTMLGGFRAVVNTDALQAVMMISALVTTCLILLWTTLGSNPNPVTMAPPSASALSPVALVSALAWGLGYPGQPHILSRFMATRSRQAISAAGHIAVMWTIFCLISAVAIGYLASRHPTLGAYAGDAEKIFIVASELIFHPIVAGAVTAAILAAIMSTADSQLLIAASALYYDLSPTIRHAQSPRTWLRGMRVFTAIIGSFSVLFALNPNSSVLGLVAYAWAGFGASFGPAVIFSIFSTRIGGKSIVLGMVSGAVTVILWEVCPIFYAELYSLIPGFIVNVLVVTFTARYNR